jgi:precorrin-6A/cobalt-precorrin-6A reductase
MTHRILVLGGTSEARQLASRLAAAPHLDITLSLAGRTTLPASQPVPVRRGGFGGPAGLTDYIREHRIELLVDATHPFAARISASAAIAAAAAGVPIVALRRPPWTPEPGDEWIPVGSPAEAAVALGDIPRRVFLALGRQDVGAFETSPHHEYLIRSIDPVEPPLAVPRATYLLARGPFLEAEERDLLVRHRIDAIVCKNSGGPAAHGKVVAARRLGMPVLMIARPPLPDVPAAESVEGLLAMIGHRLAPAEKRGV